MKHPVFRSAPRNPNEWIIQFSLMLPNLQLIRRPGNVAADRKRNFSLNQRTTLGDQLIVVSERDLLFAATAFDDNDAANPASSELTRITGRLAAAGCVSWLHLSCRTFQLSRARSASAAMTGWAVSSSRARHVIVRYAKTYL
jgi:hypothetical protein